MRTSAPGSADPGVTLARNGWRERDAESAMGGAFDSAEVSQSKEGSMLVIRGIISAVASGVVSRTPARDRLPEPARRVMQVVSAFEVKRLPSRADALAQSLDAAMAAPSILWPGSLMPGAGVARSG